MKASELIRELTVMKAIHGDCEVGYSGAFFDPVYDTTGEIHSLEFSPAAKVLSWDQDEITLS